MIALQEEHGPCRKRAGQLQDEARQPGWLSVRMTQGTPRDVVTDTSRMERVQQSGAIARLGWPQDTSTDWEGDIPKDQDTVRDCRERCSSWTGLDDLRGRQPPSPFLYVHFVPERVNHLGLYSLPQHILCALEYPLNLVPIFISVKMPAPLNPASRMRLWVSAPAGKQPFAKLPAIRSDLLQGASTKEGSQCKSCVYSWALVTTSTSPPARNTG